MATSNIKLFDENKGNMMGDTEYGTNTQRLNGVQQGIASSQLNNKFSYQTSLVAYALAQIMMQNGFNANDSDAVTTFVSNMSNTLLQKVTDKANKTMAEAGIDDSHFMTPLQVKNAINSIVPLLDSIASTSTKQLYGLGADAVPDDVFALLGTDIFTGLGNQYFWEKTKNENQVVHDSLRQVDLAQGTNTVTIQYADSINYDLEEMTVSLSNPQSIQGTASSLTSSFNLFVGKYIITSRHPNDIYYIVNGSRYLSYNGVLYAEKAEPVSVQSVRVSYGYVNSSDQSAYPPSSGDGYDYTFLGELGGKVHSYSGNYVGTGLEGENNPNSLIFPDSPDLVIISGYNYYSGSLNISLFFVGSFPNGVEIDGGYLFLSDGMWNDSNSSIVRSRRAMYDRTTKELTWSYNYESNKTNGNAQMNSKITYNWVAICFS